MSDSVFEIVCLSVKDLFSFRVRLFSLIALINLERMGKMLGFN